MQELCSTYACIYLGLGLLVGAAFLVAWIRWMTSGRNLVRSDSPRNIAVEARQRWRSSPIAWRVFWVVGVPSVIAGVVLVEMELEASVVVGPLAIFVVSGLWAFTVRLLATTK